MKSTTRKKKKPVKKQSALSRLFEKFAGRVIQATGSTTAFLIALGVLIFWGICGPIFKYSDTWQLVINTGTTIITFLMVFLIQKSQNKDSKSVQLKLNELIAATPNASNRLIDVESLSEEELNVLHQYYTILCKEIQKKISLEESHSIEEAMKSSRSIGKHQ